MIRVAKVPKPAKFDKEAGQPGERWLEDNPTSTARPPALWNAFTADLSAGFKKGWVSLPAPLVEAVWRGNAPAFALLLELGADVAVLDRAGRYEEAIARMCMYKDRVPSLLAALRTWRARAGAGAGAGGRVAAGGWGPG